jgi:hypothetical protein
VPSRILPVMSPELAIVCVTMLYAVVGVPLSLAAWAKSGYRPAAWVSVILCSGVAIYQTGLFSAGDLADVDVSGFAAPSGQSGNCQEVIATLENAGIIIERRQRRLVVAQEVWEQIPQEARQAVIACVEASAPPSDTPIDVIPRPR